METELKIRASDKKTIYGVLRGKLKKDLVIFVHGFSSHYNEPKFYNGSRFLEKHGISSFRFGLYDWRKGARKLEQCTLAAHAKDVNSVVAYFKKRGYKNIHLVGHSYGAPSILVAKNNDIKSITLWDGSSLAISHKWFLKDRYVKELKSRLVEDNGYKVVVPQKFIDHEAKINQADLFNEISTPVQFICAGKGILVKANLEFYHLVSAPRDFVVIEGATHNFDEDGKEELLFKETLRWIKDTHAKR